MTDNRPALHMYYTSQGCIEFEQVTKRGAGCARGMLWAKPGNGNEAAYTLYVVRAYCIYILQGVSKKTDRYN